MVLIHFPNLAHRKDCAACGIRAIIPYKLDRFKTSRWLGARDEERLFRQWRGSTQTTCVVIFVGVVVEDAREPLISFRDMW
jgi:hypothetical protein